MDKLERQRGMYELTGASMPQRSALAVLAGLVVLFAWWFVAGSGLGTLAVAIHHAARSGDPQRRLWLAVVRILFTEFVFLRRGVSWNEVFMIAAWLLIIVLILGSAAGMNSAPLGASAWVAVGLFLFGSWMNSWAEFTRHRWKLRQENRGLLYTGGLFRYSRHPNYLGDVISFSGLCLFSGRWFTIVVPLLMLVGFVFVNIPMLDAHLHDHYGAAFDDYAAHTRKLIPFLY